MTPSLPFASRFLAGLAVLVAAGPTRADAAGFVAAGQNRLCTPDRALCLRGQLDATGTHMVGNVAIETKLGDWVLEDARLELDAARPALHGTASIGMPALGLLGGASSSRATATVHIGFGGDTELRLAGRPFAPRADRFYIAAELQGAASVTLAGATLFEMRKGTSLLLEPATPIIYADGLVATALASILRLGAIDALGFSLDDRACIPYTTANPVLVEVGGTPAKRTACGNLLVSGELSYLAVSARGTLLVDVDANGDGTTIFDGDRRDFTVIADAAVSITLPKVKLPIEVTRASLFFEGGAGKGGRLGTATMTGRDVMLGNSPLARVLGGTTYRTYFVADDSGQQGVFEQDQAVLGGWKIAGLTANVTITGGESAYRAAGTITLPIGGKVAVTGALTTEGAYRLTAKQTIKIHDVTLQDAAITLSNDGVTIAAEAGAKGPDAKLAATLTTRRDPSTFGAAEAVSPETFGLSGKAQIELRGRKLGDGRLIATTSGLRIKGSLEYAGTTFKLDGAFGVKTYKLTSTLKVSGSKKVDFGVKKVTVGADGKAVLKISNESYSVMFEGDLDPGGNEKLAINGDGEICQKIGVKVLGQNISKKVCINLL